MVLISKACTEWCLSTHMFEEQNWYAWQNVKLQVKDKFTETWGRFKKAYELLNLKSS